MLVRILSIVLLFSYLSLAAPIERRFNGPHKLLKGLVKGKLFSGAGTYYELGLGSCGEFDTDSDMVVAVNEAQMHNGNMTQ